MHRFIEYISDLLFLHDCVIIPEFGGFICNYQSAAIDEESGIICPPAKMIVFNRNLKHNDGLLVNWVASKENIPYQKAAKQVELFTEELKVKLNQRQRIAFGDLGTFYTDRRFNIIFESDDYNFLADTYGMEKIEVQKLTSEAPKNTSSQIHIPSGSELPPYTYLNMESRNWVHRLLKYGMAAAILAGIIFLSHLAYIYWDTDYTQGGVATATVQPILPQMQTNANAQAKNFQLVISPDYDYVNYDPLAD
ncbi:hypothetical protein [Odoribacter lunatus]|uniref:HU domain-containing protein n=1 Tax=Odoribacter lunatus TaxID=2941335 RepID=UPI00203BF960|nr:hypothetical protein [Odoribacter lunatus]